MDRITCIKRRLTLKSDRSATEDLVSALNGYCIFEVDDENRLATIIAHIDVVTKVDPAGLVD